jgi:hypothetical protein
MIDHRRALDLAGVRPAFRLTGEDAAALDAHLAVCPSCPTVVARFGRDAAAVRRLHPGPAPDRLRRRIAARAATAAMETSMPPTRSILALALLALLTTVALGAAVGAGALLGNRTPGDPALAAKPVQLRTEVVTLAADALTIRANGRLFTPLAGPGLQVSSDPGSETAWTLEVEWREQGVEQRLYLYFAADATSWWINEIRTRDGVNPPEWATFPAGPHARTPRGMAWTGDLQLTGQGRGGDVTLRIAGGAIAVDPRSNITEPIGGGLTLPGEDANPFGESGALRCSGILQLSPSEAEAHLLALGYKLSWRWEYSTGGNTGYGEVRERAPDRGWIVGTAVGSSGELILFVQDPDRPFQGGEPGPAALPADCPAG